jgi:hypothetical protein
MENKEWVKQYIDKLLSSDLTKDSILLRNEKMPYINMPLYKYCYVIEEEKRNKDTVDYAIENFKNDVLFFQNPEKFNDPFDCYLGFSQTQVIRDVLIQELRKQRKYTPQMRKAVNMFFSDDLTFKGNIDDLIAQGTIFEIILEIMPFIKESLGEEAELIEIFNSTFLSNNIVRNLIVKQMKNSITIRDQQQFVDFLFENQHFLEYMKSKITSSDKDMILEITKHDMKINIENNSISYMGENSGETFSILDFFIFAIRSLNLNKEVPEIETVKRTFNNAAKETLTKSRKLISDQFRVTCLSERFDSPLMWSHYANKHFGFCLEYDFTHTMIKKYPDLVMAQLMLFPVIYSRKRPLISKAFFNSKTKLNYLKSKKLPPNLINNIMLGLLHKSEDWEYEGEWRILQLKSDKPTMKLPPARKVFLGANMEDKAKHKVIEIAQKKKIPVFQMYLKMDQYKFDYYKV